jgi:hypothetical protein
LLSCIQARRWRNLQLSGAWQSWREFTLIQREKRQKAVKALGWWGNRSLAASWQTWRGYVAWKRGLKAAAMAVVQKMQHKVGG